MQPVSGPEYSHSPHPKNTWKLDHKWWLPLEWLESKARSRKKRSGRRGSWADKRTVSNINIIGQRGDYSNTYIVWFSYRSSDRLTPAPRSSSTRSRRSCCFGVFIRKLFSDCSQCLGGPDCSACLEGRRIHESTGVPHTPRLASACRRNKRRFTSCAW